MRYAALVLAALAIGCQAAAAKPSFRLETDRARYMAGDSILVRIQNVTDTTVGYNTCPRVLERQEGGRWIAEESFPPPTGMCTLPSYPLAPGATAPLRFALPAVAPAGTYRVRLPWVDGLSTNLFVVGPRGAA